MAHGPLLLLPSRGLLFRPSRSLLGGEPRSGGARLGHRHGVLGLRIGEGSWRPGEGSWRPAQLHGDEGEEGVSKRSGETETTRLAQVLTDKSPQGCQKKQEGTDDDLVFSLQKVGLTAELKEFPVPRVQHRSYECALSLVAELRGGLRPCVVEGALTISRVCRVYTIQRPEPRRVDRRVVLVLALGAMERARVEAARRGSLVEPAQEGLPLGAKNESAKEMQLCPSAADGLQVVGLCRATRDPKPH